MELEQINTTGRDTVTLSEFFGPTYQGEGPLVGHPCYFVRLQHCPVQCPGCDTVYTWDGSETGQRWGVEALRSVIEHAARINPRAGLVVSGGEPMIYASHRQLNELFSSRRRHRTGGLSWVTVETSGFCGPKPLPLPTLYDWCASFDHVTVSPKITPCLHPPKWTDEQLLLHVPDLLEMCSSPFCRDTGLSFKLVCRDGQDVSVVDDFVRRFHLDPGAVYVMPYGVEADEVAAVSRSLLPLIASRGYVLSPRLHALLWGKRRGV